MRTGRRLPTRRPPRSWPAFSRSAVSRPSVAWRGASFSPARRDNRGMDADRIRTLQTSYDGVAEAYVERIYGELAHKPLDRELLDAFAGEVKGSGIVCDVGCGPGHVSRYLGDRGVDVMGLDL